MIHVSKLNWKSKQGTWGHIEHIATVKGLKYEAQYKITRHNTIQEKYKVSLLYMGKDHEIQGLKEGAVHMPLEEVKGICQKDYESKVIMRIKQQEAL